MTHNGLELLGVIAVVLAAGVGLGIVFLRRAWAARRRNALLDWYARRQLELRTRKGRPSPARGRAV